MDNTINEKRVVIFKLLQGIKDDAIDNVVALCEKERGKPLTSEPTDDQESALKPYLQNEPKLRKVKPLLNKFRAQLALLALQSFTEMKGELKKIAFAKASIEKKVENLKAFKDKAIADSTASFWNFRAKSTNAKSIKKVTKNMDLESLFTDKAKEKTAKPKKETAPKAKAVKKAVKKETVKQSTKKAVKKTAKKAVKKSK